MSRCLWQRASSKGCEYVSCAMLRRREIQWRRFVAFVSWAACLGACAHHETLRPTARPTLGATDPIALGERQLADVCRCASSRVSGDVACRDDEMAYEYDGVSEGYVLDGQPTRERYRVLFELDGSDAATGRVRLERYEVLVRSRMSCSPHGGVLPRTFAVRDSRGMPEGDFADVVRSCL